MSTQSIGYRIALDNRDMLKGMREAQREVRDLNSQAGSSNLGDLSGELQLASGSATQFSSRASGANTNLRSLIAGFRSGAGGIAGFTAGAAGATGAPIAASMAAISGVIPGASAGAAAGTTGSTASGWPMAS